METAFCRCPLIFLDIGDSRLWMSVVLLLKLETVFVWISVGFSFVVQRTAKHGDSCLWMSLCCLFCFLGGDSFLWMSLGCFVFGMIRVHGIAVLKFLIDFQLRKQIEKKGAASVRKGCQFPICFLIRKRREKDKTASIRNGCLF